MVNSLLSDIILPPTLGVILGDNFVNKFHVIKSGKNGPHYATIADAQVHYITWSLWSSLSFAPNVYDAQLCVCLFDSGRWSHHNQLRPLLAARAQLPGDSPHPLYADQGDAGNTQQDQRPGQHQTVPLLLHENFGPCHQVYITYYI